MAEKVTTSVNGAAPAGARRQDDAILSAALRVFSEEGFNGASMRAIAQAAQTSLSNLYNYYPSKQALLFTVLGRSNEVLVAQLRAAADQEYLTPTERLAAAVRAHVLFVIEHLQLSRVALSEVRYLDGQMRLDIIAGRDRIDAVIREIVEAGAASHEFRTPYPAGAARAILSMNSAICTWYRPDGPLTSAQIAEAQSRYALGVVEAVGRVDPA